MTLVCRLTLTLLAGFSVLLAIQACLSMQEFAEAYEADISRDHRWNRRGSAGDPRAGITLGR